MINLNFVISFYIYIYMIYIVFYDCFKCFRSFFFSLLFFSISSYIARRDTCKAKNTFPLIFSRTPHKRDDEQCILASLHECLLLVIFSDWQQKLWFQTACMGSWYVSQVCFLLFGCQDIQMHDKLSLWCFYLFFIFFTFGQCPVLVKQITTSFFKIIQKALVSHSIQTGP